MDVRWYVVKDSKATIASEMKPRKRDKDRERDRKKKKNRRSYEYYYVKEIVNFKRDFV